MSQSRYKPYPPLNQFRSDAETCIRIMRAVEAWNKAKKSGERDGAALRTMLSVFRSKEGLPEEEIAAVIAELEKRS